MEDQVLGEKGEGLSESEFSQLYKGHAKEEVECTFDFVKNKRQLVH